MPRIRSIKPEHWNDKNLPKISLGAHLLWISMWNFSDDKGIIEYDCLLIKSNSFPRRKEIKPSHIKKWVDELIKYDFIIPLKHQDIQYLIHRTFDVHQKIDRPQPSKVDEETIRRAFDEHSTNTRRTLDDDSVTTRRKERIGEDRRVKERIGGEGDTEKKIDNSSRISMPFGEEFKKMWIEWKKYKIKQHDFDYKSEGSEQAALHELVSIAYSKESMCVEIIKQSMANGWKGFFQIKNSNNGKQPTGKDVNVQSALDKIDSLYAKDGKR